MGNLAHIFILMVFLGSPLSLLGSHEEGTLGAAADVATKTEALDKAKIKMLDSKDKYDKANAEEITQAKEQLELDTAKYLQAQSDLNQAIQRQGKICDSGSSSGGSPASGSGSSKAGLSPAEMAALGAASQSGQQQKKDQNQDQNQDSGGSSSSSSSQSSMASNSSVSNSFGQSSSKSNDGPSDTEIALAKSTKALEEAIGSSNNLNDEVSDFTNQILQAATTASSSSTSPVLETSPVQEQPETGTLVANIESGAFNESGSSTPAANSTGDFTQQAKSVIPAQNQSAQVKPAQVKSAQSRLLKSTIY